MAAGIGPGGGGFPPPPPGGGGFGAPPPGLPAPAAAPAAPVVAAAAAPAAPAVPQYAQPAPNGNGSNWKRNVGWGCGIVMILSIICFLLLTTVAGGLGIVALYHYWQEHPVTTGTVTPPTPPATGTAAIPPKPGPKGPARVTATPPKRDPNDLRFNQAGINAEAGWPGGLNNTVIADPPP